MSLKKLNKHEQLCLWIKYTLGGGDPHTVYVYMLCFDSSRHSGRVVISEEVYIAN